MQPSIKTPSMSALYNLLSCNGIIDTPIKVLSSEEDFMSDSYQDFKLGFYGSLYGGEPLKVKFLGQYGDADYSRILLEIKTIDDQKTGIVDIMGMKTVVPINYITIELIPIAHGIPLFCAHKIQDDQIFYDFYTLSGKRIITANEYQLTKQSFINYMPVDPHCCVADLSYMLNKEDEDIINNILFKKKYDAHLPAIKKLFLKQEENDIGTIECNVCWDCSGEEKHCLEQTVAYSLARDRNSDFVTFELLVKTDLFNEPTLQKFKEKYLIDHLRTESLFFANEAFMNEEEK